MSGGRGGHQGSRGTKISYQTREAAQIAAWRRSVELGHAMYVYRCKLKGRPEHFHIAAVTGQPHGEKVRLIERLSVELGERASACMVAENHGKPDDRHGHVAKRIAAAVKRRSRVSPTAVA